MRIRRLGHSAVVVWLAWGLVASFPVTGYARQDRSVADGVYSETQATRGEGTYRTACVSCHGDGLEGQVGPPLAGEAFLAIWSARSLTDLVDKIHATMPPEAPEPLTRPQAIDLAAYILQAGSFTAGQADLSDATLPDIAFPTVRTAATAAGPGTLQPPAANLAQLMRSIAFPNSNVIFNVQVRAPDAERPEPAATSFDYVVWGSTFYGGWQAIDLAALALIESTPLLLTPGRRCENGRPVPVGRPDWQQYTEALVEVSREAFRASQSRNVDAVIAVAEQLDLACLNCHAVYRDVGAEGRGQGADRCRQDP